MRTFRFLQSHKSQVLVLHWLYDKSGFGDHDDLSNVSVLFQVHPYTFRNEYGYLHYDFHQDPFQEYIYWIHTICVDGLFTDFTGSLHLYQEWTSPL
jgi:glycerophosphoryl diester phosphodiesterase